VRYTFFLASRAILQELSRDCANRAWRAGLFSTSIFYGRPMICKCAQDDPANMM
jgi:hypothetical protein